MSTILSCLARPTIAAILGLLLASAATCRGDCSVTAKELQRAAEQTRVGWVERSEPHQIVVRGRSRVTWESLAAIEIPPLPGPATISPVGDGDRCLAAAIQTIPNNCRNRSRDNNDPHGDQ